LERAQSHPRRRQHCGAEVLHQLVVTNKRCHHLRGGAAQYIHQLDQLQLSYPRARPKHFDCGSLSRASWLITRYTSSALERLHSEFIPDTPVPWAQGGGRHPLSKSSTQGGALEATRGVRGHPWPPHFSLHRIHDDPMLRILRSHNL
jgi:hypothetical protein